MCQSPRTGCDDNSNSSLYTPRLGRASRNCLMRFFDPSCSHEMRWNYFVAYFKPGDVHTNRYVNADSSRREFWLHVHVQHEYTEAHCVTGFVDCLIRLHQNRCVLRQKRQIRIVVEFDATQTFGNQFVIAGRHVPRVDLNQLTCVRFYMNFTRISIIVDTFDANAKIAWRWTVVHADRHMVFGIRSNIFRGNDWEMSAEKNWREKWKSVICLWWYESASFAGVYECMNDDHILRMNWLALVFRSEDSDTRDKFENILLECVYLVWKSDEITFSNRRDLPQIKKLDKKNQWNGMISHFLIHRDHSVLSASNSDGCIIIFPIRIRTYIIIISFRLLSTVEITIELVSFFAKVYNFLISGYRQSDDWPEERNECKS